MTQSKISASLGSIHIWRIYLSIDIISMHGTEWQYEGRFIGNISINYEYVRADKSSPLTVIVTKVITKIVKRSDNAIVKTGIFAP